MAQNPQINARENLDSGERATGMAALTGEDHLDDVTAGARSGLGKLLLGVGLEKAQTVAPETKFDCLPVGR